jgi:hypothetical protein
MLGDWRQRIVAWGLIYSSQRDFAKEVRICYPQRAFSEKETGRKAWTTAECRRRDPEYWPDGQSRAATDPVYQPVAERDASPGARIIINNVTTNCRAVDS